MPTRRDGRIEPGQKLSGAISARQWNRMADAADIVMGSGAGVAAVASSVAHLPSLRCTMGRAGSFGEVAMLLGTGATWSGAAIVAPSSQIATGAVGISLNSDENKLLKQQGIPVYTVEGNTYGYPAPFVVCAGNKTNDWVCGGFAVARVRVLNFNHRYARLPWSIPGGSAPVNDVRGAFDSCFYGPAEIAGFAITNSDGQVVFASDPRVGASSSTLTWPNYVMRWALVRI